MEKCRLTLFCDADFAGDQETSRSTSGVFLAVVGPKTFVPISALSKKQGCVSESTCEAEIVSLAFGLRSEGLPALNMWEVLISSVNCGGGKPHATEESLIVLEDNQSTIAVAEKGWSKALRHIKRTHRVNVAWIGEVIGSPEVKMHYIESRKQAADIFTKAFTSKEKFQELCELVGITRVGASHIVRVVPPARHVSFCQAASCVSLFCQSDAPRKSHLPARARSRHDARELRPGQAQQRNRVFVALRRE